MQKKEESFDSFIIVEDEIKENKKEIINKKLNTSNNSKKNNNIKKNNNNNIINIKKKKNNINKNKIKEYDNSFLKKNDFYICSDDNSNNDNKIKENIIISKYKCDFDNNLNCIKSKIFKNDIKENDKKKNERSESFNFDSRSSSIFFNNIKKKSLNNFNSSLDFIDLDEKEKDKPDPFNTECILNDKKNISYFGKLNIDQKFKVSFKINEKNKVKPYYNDEYYIFYLLSIKNINTNTNYFGNDNCVEINLKDNRYFLFKIKNSDNYIKFLNILNTFALPNLRNSYYKNAYSRFNNLKVQFNINGWDIYNFDEEFKRQGVDFKYTFEIIDNSDFKFCPSYPKKIIAPNMFRKDLEKCTLFRTKKRIPTLTYRHKNGFCIWRSSQTKSGFMGKSDKDEYLLTKIAETTNELIVYDARPKLNAMANKLKGAGYENPSNYPNIKMDIIFCGITNIHGVRSSFEKMFSNLSYDIDNEYSVISNLPNTFWYETIIIIIKKSFEIYESINDKNKTVLIHCSDGWDRTSQLASLSQILLDKYYRTLEGFIVLIEKDWLSFGHQFQYRNGFYSTYDLEVSENQFSPIFIQWLDCVYQLMCQNYSKFEFNLNLLTFIASEVFTGNYGTFLFNSEKDRELYNAKTKTISIWSIVMERKKYYLNPIYDPNNNEKMSINYKTIRLWREYFYRFEKGEKEQDYILLFNKKINEYEKKIDNKQKIIDELAGIITGKSIDLSLLSEECKKEIENSLQKSNINLSFEIWNPTESIININKNES